MKITMELVKNLNALKHSDSIGFRSDWGGGWESIRSRIMKCLHQFLPSRPSSPCPQWIFIWTLRFFQLHPSQEHTLVFYQAPWKTLIHAKVWEPLKGWVWKYSWWTLIWHSCATPSSECFMYTNLLNLTITLNNPYKASTILIPILEMGKNEPQGG